MLGQGQVRKPADNTRFSGPVLAESMHGSGAADMFEYTSIDTMSSGHAAVEILTTNPMQFVAHNEARYRDLQIAGGQANEIIARRVMPTSNGATIREIDVPIVQVPTMHEVTR